MTTIVASLVTVIDTYYGDIGGGDKPPYIVDELTTRGTPYYESGVEYIVVGIRDPVTREPLDYDYADVDHELFVYISTPDSADRLKQIVDEVRLIINTKNSGNITAQFVSQEIPKSDRKAGVYAIELIATLEQCAIPSGAAYDGFEGDASHIHNNGFVDRTASTIAFDTGTRTFTITPGGLGSFIIWQDRVEYVIDEAMTFVINDNPGTHVIYYNLGQLFAAINPGHAEMDDIIVNKVLVSIIYWNATDDENYIFADERHGLLMSDETHHYLHDVFGAQYESGLTVSNYVLDDDSDAALTFDISDGAIYDEDLEIDITGDTDAEIPVLYRDDVNGRWTQAAASNLPYLTTGSGRLAYNKDDEDGTYSQVEITNNKFMTYTLIATNDTELPIKMVQGQYEYQTKNEALEDGMNEIIAFGDFPSPEIVILYRFIMQTNTGYGGTKKAKIIEVTDFRGNPITGAGASASDHGTLSGLGDDDHEQYHNDVRGDIRYYTKAQTDSEIDTDIATHKGDADAHHNEDHTLASHSTKDHSDLDNIGVDDHHSQAHTLVSHSTKDHSNLDNIGGDDHHDLIHTHDGNGEGGTISHDVLDDVSADDHHAEAHAHTHASTTGKTTDDHHAEAHAHTHASTTGKTVNDHHNEDHSHAPGGGGGTISHDVLDDVSVDDHHAKYTDGEAVTAAVRQALIQPRILVGAGCDQVPLGAAELTLIRFPAADNNCYAEFSFRVPEHIDSGKTWYLKVTYITGGGSDSATFNYYASVYEAGTAYGGWNLASNASFGTLATGAANSRYEFEKNLGVSIDAEDVVTFRIVKTSSDSRNFHFVALALYWR